MNTWFWPRTRVLMVLSVLGFLVYFNAIAHPFVHDDVVFVQMNPNIGRWDNLLETFLTPGVPFQTLKITTPYYRPLLEIFYRLQYLLFGMNPAGFHFFNILLHILNAFLVFLLSLRLRLKKSWAFAIALIFLVHPVQSEAVACVSGISNLVVTGLVLATFLAYLETRVRTGRMRRVWQAGSAGLFCLALFSKEQAVVFPVIILLYELLWPGAGSRMPGTLPDAKRRTPDYGNFVRRWWFPATYFWLVGLYLSWRSVLFPGFFHEALENPVEFTLRLWAIPKTLLMYIGVILWPAGLHYYRSVDILIQDLPMLLGFLACALFVLSVCLSLPERFRRWAWFGLAWFLVTLLPVANIVPLINEYSLILAAEHFLYFPLVGFLIFLAAIGGWMLTTLKGQVTSRFCRLLLVFIAVILAALTIKQNDFWRGEVPLFERTLKYEPGLGRVHLLLGKAYVMQYRIQEALAEYSAGLQIMQGYVKKARHFKVADVYLQYVKTAHFDRGQCYLAMGQVARANEEYLASLAVRMQYLHSPEISGQDSLTASNLGLNFIRLGNKAEAKKYFELALQFDGRNFQALNNLGMWYMGNGEKQKARYWLEQALKVQPGFVLAWENLKKLDAFSK